MYVPPAYAAVCDLHDLKRPNLRSLAEVKATRRSRFFCDTTAGAASTGSSYEVGRIGGRRRNLNAPEPGAFLVNEDEWKAGSGLALSSFTVLASATSISEVSERHTSTDFNHCGGGFMLLIHTHTSNTQVRRVQSSVFVRAPAPSNRPGQCIGTVDLERSTPQRPAALTQSPRRPQQLAL